MDKDRLTKLLMMTTSPNDGEALNAIRMANEILVTAKVTWAELLAPPRTIRVGGFAMTLEPDDGKDWNDTPLRRKT